ncbi:hypothetical protein FDP41_003516 [Naegleria fowleri]|uniref:Uncharacterized protein n=1 Tax=Naegleria fowleri TaxID=5763 RepID=A0A6A5BTG3_NAEFO|nr:uncharacterized protein FDP41_003516 [Naegleria fowleri]KAF0977524.1 hypothetical protein FDP41_003516 [Naegleria fowleri]CAG4710176.1 unnamed protein product [Naegleria fowleri]
MTPSNTQSTTILDDGSSKIHTTSSPTTKTASRKKSSKSGKTKIKYNANGSSTVSFKLDKDCVKQQYHSASSAPTKKRNSSKLMFVDESDAAPNSSSSSDATSQDSSSYSATTGKSSSGNNSSNTAVTFGHHNVNKRLCKLRKQLKSCDHFTDNYFVIDLTSKGGQSKPQVVSFKSPTEHFILHDDHTTSDSSETSPKHSTPSSEYDNGVLNNCDEEDPSSEDHDAKQQTHKRKRKKSQEPQNGDTKKCKVSNKKQVTTTTTTNVIQEGTTAQPSSELMNSGGSNPLLEELKKQDPMLLAQLLQDLLQQNGSEVFKQMQNMLLSQFQLEVQNLMRQALEQQYATLIPSSVDITPAATTNLANTSMTDNTIDNDIFADDLLRLLDEEPSTNCTMTSTPSALEYTPTSPLSTLAPDHQEILMEQGDCLIEHL